MYYDFGVVIKFTNFNESQFWNRYKGNFNSILSTWTIVNNETKLYCDHQNWLHYFILFLSLLDIYYLSTFVFSVF